jgi:hypothetical protein
MSFNAGEILGHLRLDRSGFSAGMLEAQGITKALGTSISSFMANPLVGIANFAKDAAKSIIETVKGVAQTGEQFNKMSQITGASVEFLSGLKYAGDLADISIEELRQSLVLMNRNIAEGGKDITDLGVALKTNSGGARATEQIFLDVAQAIAQMPDAYQRAGAAQQVFGRQGASLIPLLKDGRKGITDMIDEAGRMGLVMSGATAAGAERFNDALTRLGRVWDGVKQSLVTPVLEVLADLLEKIVKLVDRARAGMEALGWIGKNPRANLQRDDRADLARDLGGAMNRGQAARDARYRNELRMIEDDRTFVLR